MLANLIKQLQKGELEQKEREQIENVIEGQAAELDGLKNQLLQANLRLVPWVASRYLYKHPECRLTFQELVSAGNLGLLRTLEKWDPARNVKFSDYGKLWVNRFIQMAVRADLRAHPIKCVSLNNLVGEEELMPAETIPDHRTEKPTSGLLKLELKQEVIEILKNHLTPQYYAVIELHFGLRDGNPRTFKQIGEALGISRQRAAKIGANALKIMREFLSPGDTE